MLHFLTEIRDDMENIGNLLKAENTSFQLTTFENLEDFYKYDQSLTDKVIEKNFCKKIYLHRAAPIKHPLKFPLKLDKRTHYAKKYKCPTHTPFLRRKIL